MPRDVSFTPQRWVPNVWALRNFDVSRDGRFLAYSANKAEQWTVYLRDLKTGRERALVDSDQAMLNPDFSPDGRTIAMQADFEGDENSNVFVVPTARGAPRRITDHPMDDASPRFSPDGGTIAFISNRTGDRENVFVIDASGGEPRQLTFLDDIVGEIAWRPDGGGIAFEAGVGSGDWVGFVDLDGKVERLVAFPDSESALGGDAGRPAPWSPDGKELAFVSNVHDHIDIGAIDIASRSVRWIVKNRWDKSMPLWSPDGARIAYLENRDGEIQLRTTSRSGRGTRIVSPERGVAGRPVWHPDAKGLFFIHSDAVRPQRLLLQRGARRTVLVDCARRKLPRAELAEARLVRYTSFDGRKIPALLHMPPRGRYRNAAIVIPHGGPEGQSLNEWEGGDFPPQFFVAEGFAVLYPNYRGGTGYGRAWRHLSNRDLGGGDMQDIIHGGRWLLEKGICPPGRLGIVGTSYGGYSVAHCLVQAPELWTVGASIVGFFDWFTACTNERGSLKKYDQGKMGDIDVEWDHFRRYSPYYSLQKIRAPLLITSGSHDPRCPAVDQRQMYEAMKKAGKVVDHLEFPDEGHWPRKKSNEIRLYERTLEWVKRYLPDEPPITSASRGRRGSRR